MSAEVEGVRVPVLHIVGKGLLVGAGVIFLRAAYGFAMSDIDAVIFFGIASVVVLGPVGALFHAG